MGSEPDVLTPDGLIEMLRAKHHGQTPAQIAETFFHMRAYGEPTNLANHPLGAALRIGFYGAYTFRVGLTVQEHNPGDESYHHYFIEIYEGGQLALKHEIKGPLLFFMEHFQLGEYTFLRPGWRFWPARVAHRIKLASKI